MLLQSSINMDPLSPSTMLPLDTKRMATKNASLLSTARRKDVEKGNDHSDLGNQDLASTLPIDISSAINFDHPYHPIHWPAWQRWALATIYWCVPRCICTVLSCRL